MDARRAGRDRPGRARAGFEIEVATPRRGRAARRGGHARPLRDADPPLRRRAAGSALATTRHRPRSQLPNPAEFAADLPIATLVEAWGDYQQAVAAINRARLEPRSADGASAEREPRRRREQALARAAPHLRAARTSSASARRADGRAGREPVGRRRAIQTATTSTRRARAEEELLVEPAERVGAQAGVAEQQERDEQPPSASASSARRTGAKRGVGAQRARRSRRCPRRARRGRRSPASARWTCPARVRAGVPTGSSGKKASSPEASAQTRAAPAPAAAAPRARPRAASAADDAPG